MSLEKQFATGGKAANSHRILAGIGPGVAIGAITSRQQAGMQSPAKQPSASLFIALG